MTKLSKLAYRAGYTRRWHTTSYLDQSVAEHSWGVALIIMQNHPNPSANLLKAALLHDLHEVRFAVDSYWRGETHRLCDRPGSLVRLLEELESLDVEQVILVSSAPESTTAHALSAPRLEGRARAGEYLRSTETAVLRDAMASRRGGQPSLFVIRPDHNPVGPFDFDGGFDDRSDRALTLTELMNRGYEDAYHGFIEPIVGASGEHVGRTL